MREQGVKVDSVSLGEIERALAAGYDPQAASGRYRFTADLIDEATLERVKALQIPVNAGSVDMLSQLGSLSRPSRLAARQPGFGHGHSQNQHRWRKQQTRDLVQPSAGGAGSDASLSAPAGGDPHAHWLRS